MGLHSVVEKLVVFVPVVLSRHNLLHDEVFQVKTC